MRLHEKISDSLRSISSSTNGSTPENAVDYDGHSSNFIQVLDESMSLVREDLNDWLQHYLFSGIAPAIPAQHLLLRLGSGLWLSRLAYKLQQSVFSQATGQPATRPGYDFLRGAVSNPALKSISRDALPTFPRTLMLCATRLDLGDSDVCGYPAGGAIPTRSESVCAAVGSSQETSSVPTGDRRISDLWLARDNVSSFIQWCRELGIPQTVIFETTGLVHRTEEKNVILTLMELARIASRYGLADLPELVRIEREIDALERREQEQERLRATAEKTVSPSGDSPDNGIVADSHGTNTTLVAFDQTTTGTGDAPVGTNCDAEAVSTQMATSSTTTCASADHRQLDVESASQGVGQRDASLAANLDNEDGSSESASGSSGGRDGRRSRPAASSVDTFVHIQVEEKLAQCTCCDRLNLQRLDEGRYQLGRRIYYLRRFRSHVMVRVGGGWLTLDEFLNRYDPCRKGRACMPDRNGSEPKAKATEVNGTSSVSIGKRTVSSGELSTPICRSGDAAGSRLGKVALSKLPVAVTPPRTNSSSSGKAAGARVGMPEYSCESSAKRPSRTVMR